MEHISIHVDEDPTMPSAPSVLVIDDEPALCSVICEILRSYGLVAHHALSVNLAMALLEDNTPDLILTDVMMPGIDGLSMIRRLRSEPDWSHIPTIVLSAKASPEDQNAAMEAGADGWLPKPFTAQDLCDTINKFIPVD